MWAVFSSILSAVGDAFRRRRDLEAELLALRHQVLVLNRKRGQRRVQLRPADRVFWILLSRLWSGWRKALIVVKAETVIAWHPARLFAVVPTVSALYCSSSSCSASPAAACSTST